MYYHNAIIKQKASDAHFVKLKASNRTCIEQTRPTETTTVHSYKG